MAERKKDPESQLPKVTLYEEELYDDLAVKEKTVQLVVFRLSAEWYGVEISNTKEVIKVGRITYLPSSPSYVSGITNLRGNILSVTDLKKVFGLPPEELSEKSRLVVIESGIFETGLLVDEVMEVMEVPLSKIDPALETIPSGRAEYIEGESRIDGKLIGILNARKILEVKDADNTGGE